MEDNNDCFAVAIHYRFDQRDLSSHFYVVIYTCQGIKGYSKDRLGRYFIPQNTGSAAVFYFYYTDSSHYDSLSAVTLHAAKIIGFQ